MDLPKVVFVVEVVVLRNCIEGLAVVADPVFVNSQNNFTPPHKRF